MSLVVDGPLLSIEGVTKSFGGAPVLQDVSLDVRRGEFLTFLGPSGCGKTTTLRIVAGFESPDAGRVRLEGKDVTTLPPYQRDVHTVFQHYALFPHYTVFDNVAFGLRIRKTPEPEIARRVREALSLVKLESFEGRRTTQLSGGQMQRIALARALVGRPAVLLLDEPLGALDLKLRKQMQLELKTLQRQLKVAFVYVTHDQEEAMTMSDRIAVFNRGRIEQLGSPEEIYEHPRTSFVADFIGAANILSARVLEADRQRWRLLIESSAECAVPAQGRPPAVPGSTYKVAIRPERFSVAYGDEGAGEGGLILRGTLVESVFLGNAWQLFFKPFGESGRTLLAVSMDVSHREPRKRGCVVWTRVPAADILLLEPVDEAPATASASSLAVASHA